MTAGQSRFGFDIDLAQGILKEGELGRILSLGGSRIEVKTDYKAAQTGNVFVEYEQAGPPTYKPRPSGVAITVAEWWVTVLMNRDAVHCVLVNPTEYIKKVGRIALGKGMKAKGGDNDLYRGVLVPLGWLLRPVLNPGQNMDGSWGELGWKSEEMYRTWGP
jgi:hypothetical protein